MSVDEEPGPPRIAAPLLVSTALAALGLVALSVVFSLRTASSGWAFPWFLVVLVAAVYAPGRALVRATGLRPRPLDAALLASLVGLLSACAVYWACARLGARELFWLWPAAFAVHSARRWRPPPLPAVRWSHAALAGVTLLALVPLGLVPLYYGNLARLPGGRLSYQSLSDVIFHLGIARELRHFVPPQVPFLPGITREYHYGVDLVVAMLGGAPGLDVSDLAVRFTPTWFVVLVVLAAFCFARAFLGSERGAVLFAFLVFFGEDLSWVPGWLLGSTEAWTVQFFGVPTIVSLYLLNPMLPALAFLFGGLLCLLRCCAEERGRAWGGTAALLFAGLLFFKVFAAAQLLASLGIAGVVCLVGRRDRRPLLVLLATGALVLPLTLPMVLEGSGRLWVRPDTWPWVPAAVIRAGLHETGVGRAIFAYLEGRPGSPAGGIAYWLIALPGYLVGALGARLVGLAAWRRELLSIGKDRGGHLAVAVFVALGPVLAMTWVITPAGYPPLQSYNETVWFFTQSKYVAWIFAVGFASAALAHRPRWARLALLSLLVLLAVPSAAQYLAFQVRNTSPRELSADQFAALRDLEGRSAPGDVVVAEGDLAGAVVALTHCRARVLSVFAPLALSPAELEQAQREERDFWLAWRRGTLRRDLLRGQGARFVLAESGKVPAGLSPVAVHGAVRLYEVSPGVEAPPRRR